MSSGDSTPVGRDPCGLQRRWLLSAAVASRLVAMDQIADEDFSAAGIRWPGLFVISGYRPEPIQSIWNPDAPPAAFSFHRRCPSLAADLRVGTTPATLTPLETWAYLGGIWKVLLGRWGGDFDPPDPNHFDFPSA